MNLFQQIAGKCRGLFYPFIFLCALVYIGFRVFDYHEASLAVGLSSRSVRYQQGVLRYGPTIDARDLLSGFNILCFDNAASRIRFVGWAIEVVDAKMLLWLARFFPPHPTLSLGWVVTLILSPLLLYKLIRLQTGSRPAAWLAITLFCLSAGSLSDITLRDGTVKPLVNFFAIYIFYLATIVDGLRHKDAGSEKKARGLFGLIIFVLFISFFIDETAWFLYPAVPLLFPGLFLSKKSCFFRGAYLGMFAVFLLTITFLAPVLVEKYGSGGFDFWGYITTPDFTPDVTMWERWNLNNLGLSTKNLLVSQFIPWNKHWWGIAYLIILPYLIFNFFRLPLGRRRLVLRYLLLLVAYLVYIVFYLGKGAEGEEILLTPFYYGALFSVLSILPLAHLFSLSVRGYEAVVKAGIVSFLALVFMYNFPFIHRLERSFFEGDIHRQNHLTLQKVSRAWRNWDDQQTRENFITRFPDRWFWFFPLTEPEIVRGRYLERFPPPPEVSLLKPTALTAGPVLPGSPPVDNLIDGDVETFWRSPLEDELPWVKVDFQDRQGARIKYVAMLPRRGKPEEFPRRLDLLGSVDGEMWSLVVPLLHPEGTPGEQGVSWRFINHAPYRFYKIVFKESLSGKAGEYISLAELRLTQ